mmetsp:Transcript_7407/g.20604  ORF Transcript_7407/g.20604 Transcript_7407/m.20604 type:complete len:80 (-) Transcript_7407:174-413(-)
MVNSRVQIWQATVWGKGFERQASAMFRSPLFVFFIGLGEAVRAVCGRKLFESTGGLLCWVPDCGKRARPSRGALAPPRP